ncbi:NACHT domain-containing protein [Kitasatospora acidiphila]|uniref:NACHT domain-containing protein n=1 Tax=Kitasatospora acidiphila TaxID=2567942 RepID=A0A540W585_9ACTN|nr:NACHT domain-containing protein [Kitasatospora acidiphila]TQF04162.1 NACHT domain-containing protein [Kitasatospora acidiphila]
MVFNTAIVIGDNNVQNNYFGEKFVDPLETAVQKLAMAVEAQWLEEAALRGLAAPEPFPVRWRASSIEETGDHLRLTGDPVAGSVADLAAFASVFKGLNWRRLVVLGDAGSGKSTLAVLLVIELIRQMGEGDPVPVLLTLASWRQHEHLKEWLGRQLAREYPWLDARTASKLVTYRRVLPVFDGLDELPEEERPVALKELNKVLGEGGPLILTCRKDDYLKAISPASVIRKAAVVEPEALTAPEVSTYLFDSATPQHQRLWKPLTDALVRDPSGPAATALTVPLMLWLCRAVYEYPIEGRLPGDLADLRRFPTDTAIKSHLLESLVPSVYPSGPLPPRQLDRKAPDEWPTDERHRDPKRVTAWLSYLAREQRPNLAWWELDTAMGLMTRMILIGLVSGTGVGLIVGVTDAILGVLIFAPPGHGLGYRLGYGLANGISDALLNGVPAALVFALAHGIGFLFRGAALEPSRVWTPIGNRAERSGARSPGEILARAGIGSLAGLVAGAGVGALNGFLPALFSGREVWVRYGLVEGVIFAVSFALAGGLVGALMAWLEARIALERAPGPRDLLDQNRKTVLQQMFVFAPLLGIVSGAGCMLSGELLHHSLWGIGIQPALTDGLRVAFLIALGGGLGSALSLTAWGRWVVVARIWLPFTGQLPWDAMAFLEDAHRRGVLRQVGAVYQFRHEWLQTHFAQSSETPQPVTDRQECAMGLVPCGGAGEVDGEQ